jgi:hypothetical protein
VASLGNSWEHLLQHNIKELEHMRRVDSLAALLAVAVALAISPAPLLAQTAGPAAWQNDLTPIGAKDWNAPDSAAHPLRLTRSPR